MTFGQVPSAPVRKTVRFASPLEDHQEQQPTRAISMADDLSRTMRLRAPRRPPPKVPNIPLVQQESVRLVFVDGSSPSQEIELNGREHVVFWEQFELYREISGRRREILQFEYEGQKINAHDTPSSLHMCKHAQIEVFPPDPEQMKVMSEDDDMDTYDDKSETEVEIESSSHQGEPLQSEEVDTIISDPQRIISILEHVLSFQSSLGLFAHIDAAGDITILLTSLTLKDKAETEAPSSDEESEVDQAVPSPATQRRRASGLKATRVRKVRGAAAAKARKSNAGVRGGRIGKGGKRGRLA